MVSGRGAQRSFDEIAKAKNKREECRAMAISFVRIDDRVIHGQTMTRWATQRPLNAILVISDAVAGDELRKKVLRAAAGHFKIGIYTVAQGVEALKKAKESPKNFFVISDTVEEFANLKKAGGDFGGVLNVGNIHASGGGAKNLGNAVVIGTEDIEAFDYLASQGIDLQFQLIPDNKVTAWPQIKAKYQSA
jgi:PTS system mannose-specific IIB component